MAEMWPGRVRVRDSPGDPATCKLTLKNENMTISCCCIKKYEMTHDFTESSILVTVRVGDVTYEYRKNMGDHNRIIKEKCDVQDQDGKVLVTLHKEDAVEWSDDFCDFLTIPDQRDYNQV